MSRKIVLVLAFLLFLFCFQYPLFQQNGVRASDGYPVHNLDTGLNYTTIQEAINANETLDGHVIHVDAGTYNMSNQLSIFINKSVSLVGEGRENTTIAGTFEYQAFDIFYVTSNNVTISGFTFRDGDAGVLTSANYTHITNCNFSNNVNGIQTSGTYLLFGAETIDGNIIMNNTGNGIYLSTWNNIIHNNIIFGNAHGGIVLDSAGIPTNGTRVYDNTIENNNRGVAIGGSYNNTLFHNNFLNNTVQVEVLISFPFVGNDWGGNYWSDYNGTDYTPYVIDAYNADPYPLTTQYVIEFPSFLVLQMFMIATLLAIVVCKRRHLN